jgi:hypothetical protein
MIRGILPVTVRRSLLPPFHTASLLLHQDFDRRFPDDPACIRAHRLAEQLAL